MERFQLTVNQQKTCIFHLSVRTPQLPYRVTAPLSGVSASRWGEGLQWRTQLSLQTLLNVPHWGTATALTRSRLSTRSLLDVCHRHTATEPAGETAGANRSQLSLRSLLGVPHRGTATEPTGAKAKGFLLFVGPPNFNLLNWDFRP